MHGNLVVSPSYASGFRSPCIIVLKRLGVITMTRGASALAILRWIPLMDRRL